MRNYTINYPDSISVPHTAFPEPPPETNKPPVQAIVAVPTNAVPVAPAPPPRHIEIIMAGTNHLAHEMTAGGTCGIDRPCPAPTNTVSVATASQQSQPPSTPTDSTTASTPAPTLVANNSQQANQASSDSAETKSGTDSRPTPSPVVAQSAPRSHAPVTTPAPPVAAGAVASTPTTTLHSVSQPQSTEPIAHASAPVPIPTSRQRPLANLVLRPRQVHLLQLRKPPRSPMPPLPASRRLCASLQFHYRQSPLSS